MLDKLSSNKTTNFDDGVAVGFILGVQKGKKNNNLDQDNDWSPPEMPEPEDYEIYLLVEVADVSDSYTSKLEIRVAYPETAQTGYKPLKIDWGDGTADEWNEVKFTQAGYPDYYGWGTATHNYTEVGRYLVKVFGTDYSCFLQKITPTSGMPYSKVLCAKLGAEIVVNGSSSCDTKAFNDQRRLQYIKMSGKGGLPWESLGNCYALKRIDIAVPPQEIYSSQFLGCANLKSFDFSEVTQISNSGLFGAGFTTLDLPNCLSIGNSGASNCQRLSKVYAPNCTYVGDNAFANCYNLQEIIVADDCVFGSNCFSNCFSLYPRLDGSVN